MTALLVLGGSGRTGIHVLRHAAARGHDVRALVRDPAAVAAPAGVRLVQGTPASIDDLRRAAEGAEAVISALNNSRASDNPWAKAVSPPGFMTDATRSTLTVMAERGITRFVGVSTQGAADDHQHLNLLMRGLVQFSGVGAGFRDHDGVDALLRASDVEWTLARAVALSDKPATGPLRAALRGDEKPAVFVSRADLAAFLVDVVEQGTWVRQAPLVWNTRG